MGITKLITEDKLRIETVDGLTVIATFTLVSNDDIDTDFRDLDLNVIVPIYGNPYAQLNNPVASKYTRGSVTFVGAKSSFEALDSVASPTNIQKVRLVIGGTNIPLRILIASFIIRSISYTEKIVKGTDHIVGSVAYINMS